MSNETNKHSSIAAVGILIHGERLLVIRRSDLVVAPGKICFPGGTVEPGETLEKALKREFHEEMGLDIDPFKEIDTSVTSWGAKVHWWRVHCENTDVIKPNRNEVAAFYWRTAEEVLEDCDLLESNRQFLVRVLSEEISL